MSKACNVSVPILLRRNTKEIKCSITSERGQSQVVNPGSLASEPTAYGTQKRSTGAQGTWKLPVTFWHPWGPDWS